MKNCFRVHTTRIPDPKALGGGGADSESPGFPATTAQRSARHQYQHSMEFPYVLYQLIQDSGNPVEMAHLPGNTGSEFPYLFAPKLEFPYVLYKLPDFPRFQVFGFWSFRTFWKTGSEFPYVLRDLIPCFGVSRRNVQTASSWRYFRMYFFIFEFCKPFYRVSRQFVHTVRKLQNQQKTYGNSETVTQCTRTYGNSHNERKQHVR